MSPTDARSAGVWIGMDPNIWGRQGCSPVWIELEGEWGSARKLHEPLRAWLNSDPPRAFADENGIYVPILITVGAEKERAIDDAVEQIRESGEVLSKAALRPLPTRDVGPPDQS